MMKRAIVAAAGLTVMLPALAAPPAAVPDDLIRQSTLAGTVFHDCALCPQMVVVPAGSFLMGSPETELGREVYEGPQHRVMILKQFAVGRFEISRDDWQICVTDGPCEAQSSSTGMGAVPGAGRLPMVNIAWREASQYAEWLSQRTGQNYRLLSEAEWEYVARAGSQSAYAGGGAPLLAHHEAEDEGVEPRLGAWHVGSFKPNAFGLYDMQGNVWEWVQDCFHASLAGAPADGSAWTEHCDQGAATSGSDPYVARMARGGSWKTPSVHLRPAHRAWAHSAEVDIGFRLARALKP
jgi:formylglycine-generating enzyme required for sulfatase activity